MDRSGCAQVVESIAAAMVDEDAQTAAMIVLHLAFALEAPHTKGADCWWQPDA